MKHETSNLLIGLGIGAVVGVAVGYLMVADNRKKLAEEFDRAVSKVKEEVKDVYSKAKNKAENVKEQCDLHLHTHDTDSLVFHHARRESLRRFFRLLRQLRLS